MDINFSLNKMINPINLLVSCCIISSSLAASISYQSIKFFPPSDNSKLKESLTERKARSHHFPHTDLFSETIWPFGFSVDGINDQLPIDFSSYGFDSIPLSFYHQAEADFPNKNAIEHYDPFLLVGPKAALAVQHLYKKELFFENFPHIRAILNNNKLRLLNGLGEIKLGSLRDSSPWSRNEGIAGLSNPIVG